MDDLVFEYMEGLLRLQETKLKCINLGFSQDKMTKIELDLIKRSLDMLKDMKKRREYDKK